MSEPSVPVNAVQDGGRTPALLAYGLYLLSIPSAALFAPVGLVIAYASRWRAVGVSRTHLEDQIRIFWIAFAWGALLFLASIPAWILTLVLIGIPLLWLIWAAGFVVMLWFTVRSGFGLWRLLSHQPA
ncbi:MAG: hypothetical protein AB7M12_00750 [Hyphomonadaceae bacterium]